MLFHFPRLADVLKSEKARRSNSPRNLRAVSRSTNRKKGATVGKDGDWQESKHPRSDNGQFSSGGGSTTSGPSDNKPKAESSNVDEQSRWQDSLFYNEGEVPTKESPAEIDSYPYWYGDSEYTDQEAPAITYFHEGVQIYAPQDSELRFQNRIEDEAIERAIESVPLSLREYIHAVQINPYAEEDQSARAQAEGNTIILFGDQDKYDAEETTEELPYIFNHEAAHLWDQANKRVSQSEEYKAAVKSDGNHVTTYSEENLRLDGINGRNGYAEDFAESCAHYFTDPGAFNEKHPARAKILESTFGSDQKKSILAPSALDRLGIFKSEKARRSNSPRNLRAVSRSTNRKKGATVGKAGHFMILKSIDYGDVLNPRLGDDYMEDFKEEKDEELEKGSDTDLVQSILADESGGLDALQQAIDQTQDPQLKEILEAIKEDETKHAAALQQWVEMAGGSGEEEPAEEAGDEEAPEPASSPDEGGEEVPIESDADLNDGPMDEGEEEEEEPLGKEDAPKSDLIDEIRAILEEHEAEKADDEGEEGEESEDKPDFLKEAEPEEDEDLEKEDDEEEDLDKACDKINKHIAFIAKSADQQVVYGVVSEPGTVDLQGDRLSESEIRKACHKFMMTSQKIGKEHSGEAKADIIESYIAPVDFKCGGQHVRKGSWVMACKVHEKSLWDAIKKGEITGFSIAGTGTRTEF